MCRIGHALDQAPPLVKGIGWTVLSATFAASLCFLGSGMNSGSTGDMSLGALGITGSLTVALSPETVCDLANRASACAKSILHLN